MHLESSTLGESELGSFRSSAPESIESNAPGSLQVAIECIEHNI